MVEVPIIVSTNEMSVGSFASEIDLELSVGPQGIRGSHIFSGPDDPNTLPNNSIYFGGYTEFLIGDVYIQRSESVFAMWEWQFDNLDNNYKWVKTVNDLLNSSNLDASAIVSGIFDIARIPTGTSGSTVALGNHTHSTYQPLDADLTAISALSGTGYLKRTGADTWTLDTSPSSSVAWGSITGTLSSQTDLQSALDGKQASDADLTAIASLAGTSGLLKKTAANTWSLDTNTYLTANQTITLSGDVTGSGSTSISTAISSDSVTYAKMQNISAQYRVLGRISASAGDTEELTGENIVTVLGQATSKTGSGNIVFSTSPSLTTPSLGVATATSINKIAITAPANSATLTIADGTTLQTTGTANIVLAQSTAGVTTTMPASSGQLVIDTQVTMNSLANIHSTTATATTQLAYGATISGAIKTVNIGGNGVSGSTTNINIGSSVSGATNNIALYGTTTAADLTATGQIYVSTLNKLRVGTQHSQTDGVFTANLDQDVYVYLAAHGASAGSTVRGWVSSGTYASKTAVAANRNMLVLDARGWGGTDYRLSSQITLGADSSGTFSDTSMPGKISFLTSANSSVTATERMKIASTGLVTMNNGLTVSGTVILPSTTTVSAPSWTSPTLTNGTNFGSPYDNFGYSKDALGVVRLRGYVTVNSGLTVVTLPSGFRPTATKLIPCMAFGGTAVVSITSAGVVQVAAYTGGGGTALSFDAVSFPTY